MNGSYTMDRNVSPAADGAGIMTAPKPWEYWFAAIPGLGTKDKLRLLQTFGTEEALYHALKAEPECVEALEPRLRAVLLEAQKDEDWKRSYEELKQRRIKLVCITHREYPEKLKRIYDPPYCLYVKGSLPQPGQRTVAVVGARSCSAYGQAVAFEIGRQLAHNGIGIISGLAIGIDAAAHRGALAAEKGATYAVMGCGADVCYPKANRGLYMQIQECGGILSEFPVGCQPRKHLFPLRNRIISGLSDAVIVVEARRRSGSLITADCALEQGRAVYAVPGRINDSLSYGANWLLSQGAAPFYSLEEFLHDMGIGGVKKQNIKKIMENSLEKNERLVYSVLDLTPKHLESILEETELDFSEAADALYRLGECGYIKEIYKNHYIKSSL